MGASPTSTGAAKKFQEILSNKDNRKDNKDKPMALELGAFSVSLAVADLKTSLDFYENLGFSVIGGDVAEISEEGRRV